jgi:predicted phage tail protein
MSDKLRTIRLYGTLGARFGREFELAVSSTAEAVRALTILLPGFGRFMMEAKDKGMAFAVFNGKRNLSKDQLDDPVGDDMIRIAPVLQGSKRGGVLQTIVGAVLIVAGVVLATTPFGAPLVNLGVAMVVGGVVQMLSPQPKGLGTQERPENRPSYSFNGPVNVQAQGNPVPVGYGECWAGSAVVSGGIYAEDQA